MLNDIAILFLPFYQNKQQTIKKHVLLKAMSILLFKHSITSFNWITSISKSYGITTYNRKDNLYILNFVKYEELLKEWKIEEKEIIEAVERKHQFEEKKWEEIKTELFG